MFWLGLLLPLSFIPGITGASIPTQWAVLSIVLPTMVWRCSGKIHWTWIAFLCFAILGQLWAPEPSDTIFGIWLAVLWGLSFQLGRATEDPRPLYQGLALGLSVSSVVAIFQALGYHPVPTNSDNIAGLVYNRTVLGAISAMVALVLIEAESWLWLALLPGLVLCGSRGGMVIFICGLTSRLHWLMVPAIVIVAAVAATLSPGTSDIERLQVWATALRGLTFLGWSANSFNSVYIAIDSHVVHPEFVHNDYLQLAFEFGLGALLPITVLALGLIWRPTPLLWAFAILGGFWFPLWHPLTAFLGCFALGHSLRDFSPSGLLIRHCRPDLLSGFTSPRSIVDPPRLATLPSKPSA